MRVTNSMLVSNFMNNLNNGLGRMGKLQTQMTTGRKYASITDDPVSVVYSMQAQFRLNRLERYQKSVEMAQSWLTQAETSVMEIEGIFTDAYETVIGAATNVKTDDDRANMASYVKQLRDQVLETLNTSFGNKYIFAGFNTTGSYPGNALETPFTVDETTGHLLLDGIDLNTLDPSDPEYDRLQKEMLDFTVGNGLTMDVQINGINMVGTGEDNLYAILDNIYNVLTDTAGVPLGDMVEALQEYIPTLQERQGSLMALCAGIGGRANRLEMMADRYEIDYLNYTEMKSDAEDADEAELIMQYKMAESVYKAALSSGSYIIQQTLMDFMR